MRPRETIALIGQIGLALTALGCTGLILLFIIALMAIAFSAIGAKP